RRRRATSGALRSGWRFASPPSSRLRAASRPCSRRDAVGSLRAVAVVKSFRAVRYDERWAGPLETNVAPPYDVIGPEERARYLARSPYNVVHLTLPDDEADAARLWQRWLQDGVLARDADSAAWWLSQE